ncbi:methyltransferase domain-containing protein [Heliobacillus mobilis]|uniref:Methyltransferase domain-containing protein n=1 Tax=Heliobacterium mobile TaxID=28064 RepID=A0A6I3SIR1_HELMO|nr:methyltransferase domain-containing protein [Heliobacterium mobile]
MNTHEFDGQKYKKASGHQKEWGNKIISELNLCGTEYILDLGCGDGVLTKELADRTPKGTVLGIDASVGMINAARELEQRNVSFQRMDINEIRFENQFDLIFSNAALHWVKDHDNLLQRTYQALKPQGTLRFNFAGDGNCSNFFSVIKQIMTESSYREFFDDFEWPWYMPKVDDYRELVERSNFRDVLVWEENSDRYFKNKDEMIRWIEQPSVVPFLKYLPEDGKRGFVDEVIKRMIERTEQPDGTCFETFRRINVLARK